VERLEVRGADVPSAALRLVPKAAGAPGEPVTLELELAAGAPLGLNEGVVRLTTNVPHQPTFELSYRAQVFADVVPDRHPIRFDAVRQGQPATLEVRLSSRSGRPFDVEAVTADRPQLEAAVAPCGGEGGVACAILSLRYLPDAEGVFGGVVKLRLAGDPEQIPLTYNGFVLPPGTDLRRIDAGDAARPTPEEAP
jgi:hypothetical protein